MITWHRIDERPKIEGHYLLYFEDGNISERFWKEGLGWVSYTDYPQPIAWTEINAPAVTE